MKPTVECNICFKQGDGVWAGWHKDTIGHNDFSLLYGDNDEPPPSMDFASRCVSAFGVLCWEIQRYSARMDNVCLISGANLRRRNFNL